MKSSLIAVALLAGVALSPVAQAKGCLKGAAAGCAVGHHRANKKEQQAQQAQQAQQTQQAAPAQAPAPATTTK